MNSDYKIFVEMSIKDILEYKIKINPFKKEFKGEIHGFNFIASKINKNVNVEVYQYGKKFTFTFAVQ